jgi:hypothetical protein
MCPDVWRSCAIQHLRRALTLSAAYLRRRMLASRHNSRQSCRAARAGVEVWAALKSLGRGTGELISATAARPALAEGAARRRL